MDLHQRFARVTVPPRDAPLVLCAKHRERFADRAEREKGAAKTSA